MNYFKTLSVAAGAVLSMAAVATLLGVKDVPRPAWSNEMEQVAGDLIELDSRVTSQQLDDIKTQYYQNQREQREYEVEPVPDYLIEEQIELERLQNELEHRLKELRETT